MRAGTEEAYDLGLFTFTSVDGWWIPPSEVESQRATLFREEYYASQLRESVEGLFP